MEGRRFAALGMISALLAGGCITPSEPGSASGDPPVDTEDPPPPPDETPTDPPANVSAECDDAQAAWIWCDDFEDDRTAAYFEFNRAGGNFVRAGDAGRDGSFGLRTIFEAGAVSVGWLHVAFGRTPQAYMDPVDAGTADYREIYWRFYVRNQDGWTGGGGDKLSRLHGFTSPDSWQRSFAAHVWSGGRPETHDYLVLDPASGTEPGGGLHDADAGWRWLGSERGSTPIFGAENVGAWYCVEVHVRLNDPGAENGVFELWLDDELEARRAGLDWVGTYDDYAINALKLDNYWNDGSPRRQERYLDNFVVSRERIGCL